MKFIYYSSTERKKEKGRRGYWGWAGHRGPGNGLEDLMAVEAALAKCEESIRFPKKKDKGTRRKKDLPPVEQKPGITQTEDILNSILPPREWTEDGQLWVQYVSSTPATRLDVINLQVKLDHQVRPPSTSPAPSPAPFPARPVEFGVLEGRRGMSEWPERGAEGPLAADAGPGGARGAGGPGPRRPRGPIAVAIGRTGRPPPPSGGRAEGISLWRLFTTWRARASAAGLGGRGAGRRGVRGASRGVLARGPSFSPR